MNSLVRKKLDKFFGNYNLREFKKGEVLIRAGAVPVGVFYLADGVVRQYSTSPDEREFVINMFRAPSFFPMPWVLGGRISKYEFETVTGGVAWCAPKHDFLGFLKTNPEVVLDLLKRIYSGLEGYTLRLESLLVGSAYTRLVVGLLVSSRRFGKRLALTQDGLASQTGLTRETVNREMHKLKDRDLVAVEGKVLVIKNLGKLEEELCF